jgi:hypothetical protein
MKDLDAFGISKMLQDIQFEQEVNQLHGKKVGKT